MNRSLSLGGEHHGTGHIRHVNQKCFVRFDESVAVDRYIERISLLAGRNCLAGQTARHIIAAGDGGPVGGGNIESYAGRRRGQARSYCESECIRATVAFSRRNIIDVEYRTVVVLNSARALAIAHGGSGNIRHVHKEGFVRLNVRIAVDRYIEVVSLLPSRDRLVGKISRNVIVIRHRRSIVLGCDIECNATGERGGRQINHKMEGRGTAVALVSRHVTDRKRWEIVILNRPDTLTIADRRAGCVRDVDEECFVGLDCVIAVNRDGERVSSLSRGNDLVRQTLRYIIAVRSGCGVVLRRNVKRHIRALRGRGKSYREGRGGGSAIAFNYRNVIDRQIGSRAARTIIQRRTRITRERRRSEEISRVVVCVHAAAGFSKVRSSIAGRCRWTRSPM